LEYFPTVVLFRAEERSLISGVRWLDQRLAIAMLPPSGWIKRRSRRLDFSEEALILASLLQSLTPLESVL
jgi:hypothetical protein